MGLTLQTDLTRQTDLSRYAGAGMVARYVDSSVLFAVRHWCQPVLDTAV